LLNGADHSYMSAHRYISDAEVLSFRRMVPPTIQLAIDLVLVTSLTLDCLLALNWHDIDTVRRNIKYTTGIRVKRTAILRVTSELESLLVAARRMPPQLPRMYIIRLEDGMPVSKKEFNQIWRIYMRRWAALRSNRTPFTFEELRLKSIADKHTNQTTIKRRGH